MSGEEDESRADALHAARAVLGGQPLNITTDEVFASLWADPRFFVHEVREARRVFDAMLIGHAVEKLEADASGSDRLLALVRLARAIRPHLASRHPGWFRFLLALGRQRGESGHQLSFVRRPQSDTAQPRAVLDRTRLTARAIKNMLVAGAILSRIEAAKVNGVGLPIDAAIHAAITDGDITTESEAAKKAWYGFRKDCANLTGGQNTYRLERYSGTIPKYNGRWIALPDSGIELPVLPPAQGGRPKTT